MITKMTHVTLFVRNQDEALNFYTVTLGLKVHTDAMFGSDLRWLTVCPENQPTMEIALIQASTPVEQALVGKQGATRPFLTFETDDCQATYAALSSRGVKFATPPEKHPWGIAVLFEDLYGNRLYLCQPNVMPTSQSKE